MLPSVTGIVGQARVSEQSSLGNNTGLFRQRQIQGIIRPRSADEVREIVACAPGPLHAYSTGRNWGLGSREPAVDGAIALDLRDLDRIRDLDVDAGWALIEPGVTQGRLAYALEGTGRMLNVTVSTAHSSVLGNALDRGVGLRHQRVEDLVGLEVVLPSGELMRVGWWPGGRKAVYPHSLGPSLVQLFVQSNLGIVTAGVVRLLPRPELLRVVRLCFNPDALGPAVVHMRRWRQQGLVSGVLKIYNAAAARGYGITTGDMLAHVCVDGTERGVEALSGIITDEATASGVFTSAGLSADPVTELVERSYGGDPDVTDTVFEAKMGMAADKLDDHIGFLFFLPLVPFTAEALTSAETMLQEISRETSITIGGTMNVIGADIVDVAIALKFDRVLRDVAHRALELLYERFTAAGFHPYRLDVDRHEWFDVCGPSEQARAFLRQLKDFIDPNRTIAPGRYF